MQRWPETKRLLGLLVNSSGRAHGRNARRLVHAARNQDRRLAVALLAASVSHTPEGEEVLRGARMRAARKPSAVARELLKNFPKGGKKRRRKKGSGARKKGGGTKNGKNGDLSRGLRWTSPAPRATVPPPERATRRWPTSSIPAATPEPPSQLISRPRQRVALTAKASRTPLRVGVDPVGEPLVERLERRLDRDAVADRGRRAAQVSGELLVGDRDVEADADHRPAVLGRASISTPANLRPSIQTSLGHLTWQRTGASDSAASATASGTASGSSGRSPGSIGRRTSAE